VAAIQYAVRHPERVRQLVLYGCYSRGWRLRADADLVRHNEAMLELIDIGWGGRTRAFTELYTSRFIPGATDEQLEWFNELCRKSVPRANAARLMSARGDADVRALLPHVRVPTLVLHAREDAVIGVEEGRILAAEIPNARFVELDSANHILLSEEPAWQRFCQAMLDFTGTAARVTESADGAFAVLSAREREVLRLVAAGFSNGEIAAALVISDKTVRNHISHVFAKLGVWTRPQAIVLAKDNGY
jgi:DNA-binding NarL/FixJ family response regulator